MFLALYLYQLTEPATYYKIKHLLYDLISFQERCYFREKGYGFNDTTAQKTSSELHQYTATDAT